MLEWDNKYELGNTRIDVEHRIFFELMIDFQQASLQGASKDKQLRVLSEIAKYADFHFLSEENIMEDFNYPDKAHHASLHQSILANLNNMIHEFRRENISATEIFEFLFQWFALHTSSEDKKLVGFISNK
ncbi:MAG: bacteriohemerythrin [Methylotenera sp.]|nr:bacteriohemerythrin [Methylotenera sp.]